MEKKCNKVLQKYFYNANVIAILVSVTRRLTLLDSLYNAINKFSIFIYTAALYTHTISHSDTPSPSFAHLETFTLGTFIIYIADQWQSTKSRLPHA